MNESVSKTVVLCNCAIQDKENRWTLVAVFNRMFVTAIPAKTVPFTMFTQIYDMPKIGSFMIHVESPSGMVIWTSQAMLFEIKSENEEKTFDGTFTIGPFVATAYGKHRVSIYIDQLLIGDTLLTIAPVQEKVLS